MRSIVMPLALLLAACLAPASAARLDDMQGFDALLGRYGPLGDCTGYPQVVVDADGIGLDHGGGRIERAGLPEYAASYYGPDYDGIARVFFPYWTNAGPNPLLLTVNHDEKRGRLVVEPHDLGWRGGPPMPARFRPWLQGSPYAKCK